LFIIFQNAVGQFNFEFFYGNREFWLPTPILSEKNGLF
jgi:uncharacterized protein YegP (UPF0339 family)